MKNLKLLDGIYYGWAKILNDPARENNVYPMSASIGNNPTYGNPNRFVDASPCFKASNLPFPLFSIDAVL